MQRPPSSHRRCHRSPSGRLGGAQALHGGTGRSPAVGVGAGAAQEGLPPAAGYRTQEPELGCSLRRRAVCFGEQEASLADQTQTPASRRASYLSGSPRRRESASGPRGPAQRSSGPQQVWGGFPVSRSDSQNSLLSPTWPSETTDFRRPEGPAPGRNGNAPPRRLLSCEVTPAPE